MNIDKFKDFKFSGKDISKLMHKNSILWQKRKSKYSGKFLGIDMNSKKFAISDDFIKCTTFGNTIAAGWYDGLLVTDDNFIISYPENSSAKSIYYTKDEAKTWIASQTLTDASSVADMCYDGEYVYCIGESGIIMRSTDLTTWSEVRTNIPRIASPSEKNRHTALKYCKKHKLYVCTGTSGTYLTKDITNPTWTKLPLALDRIFTDGNELIMANGVKLYQYKSASNNFDALITSSTTIFNNYNMVICNGYVYISTSTGTKFYRIPLNRASTSMETISLIKPISEYESNFQLAVRDNTIHFQVSANDNKMYRYKYDTMTGKSTATAFTGVRFGYFISIN